MTSVLAPDVAVLVPAVLPSTATAAMDHIMTHMPPLQVRVPVKSPGRHTHCRFCSQEINGKATVHACPLPVQACTLDVVRAIRALDWTTDSGRARDLIARVFTPADVPTAWTLVHRVFSSADAAAVPTKGPYGTQRWCYACCEEVYGARHAKCCAELVVAECVRLLHAPVRPAAKRPAPDDAPVPTAAKLSTAEACAAMDELLRGIQESSRRLQALFSE